MGADERHVPVLRRGGVIDPLTGQKIAIGGSGGEVTHTITIAEMPNHKHNFENGMAGFNNNANIFGFPASVDQGTMKQIYANDSYGITSTGGGQSHNNMPPYVGVCAWRRIE